MRSYAERMSDALPDLADLDLLVRIARAGSLGRVANELAVSQPGVSRRVVRLERALGLELLDRGPRGTALTPSGRVVVGWAEELLTSAREFGASVSAMRLRRKTSLRVAASMTVAEHLAPAWLARLRDQHPESTVSLSVHNSTEVTSLVEQGEADLGFVESPTVRGSLRRRRIAWDELLVVVRSDHPWARRRRPITAETLSAEPLLVREAGSGTRETVDEALRRAGLTLTPLQTLASNAALKSSALVGVGPAVLSGLSVENEVRSGQLVDVAVTGIDLRRPLSVVWRDGVRLPQTARELLRLVLAQG